MSLYDFVIAPFHDYGFMRRALVATIALGFGAAPIGVLLMLRRMSLVSGAMSHAVLPGVAIGYILAGGLSLWAMGIGALISGLIVSMMAGIVSRRTIQTEDATFASFHIGAFALGVLLISLKGSNIELLSVLFGNILAADDVALYIIGGITTFTLFLMAVIYRPLVVECFDPVFLRSVGGKGSVYHALFLLLLVLNLVAGFQTLGALMAVGIMMLPAVSAQLWTKNLPSMMILAVLLAFVSGVIGLLVSYHFNLASGAAITLTATCLYLLSLLFAPAGVLASVLSKNRSLGVK